MKDGEYKEKGEYHKKLDKKWHYYPIYVEKMRYIDSIMKKIPKNKKILDVGCGEGVLVERYKKKGYNIKGVDYNYSSKDVMKGDITNLKNIKNNSYDYALCLDVIEHLNFDQQEKAVSELKRVVKKNGILILSVPNLAHLASRITFFFTGKLLRTSTIERHKGDRPIKEYMELVKKNKFKILKRKGIFPTCPILSVLTYMTPGNVVFLHKLYNTFLAYPNFCFLNIMSLRCQ